MSTSSLLNVLSPNSWIDCNKQVIGVQTSAAFSAEGMLIAEYNKEDEHGDKNIKKRQ